MINLHRFFISEGAVEGEVVKINGGDFNHISHSLRLKPGDRITVSTGDGQDYLLELQDFMEDEVRGKVIKKEKNRSEPSVQITLAQAIPKKAKMELIVQKGTEIGITGFIPLETDRTIVKLTGKKRDRRVERWQRIVEEAAKQSGRGIIPEVMDILTLNALCKKSDDYDLILLLWEDEKAFAFHDIRDRLIDAGADRGQDKKDFKVLIIVGPEGGFSKEEADLITQQGGYTLTLGPRILRTETAGIVAATIVLYETGNMGGIIK